MLSSKQKFQFAAGFAALLLFAAGVGCNGFFVDPTLTSITVTPASTSLQTVGQTQQLTATGNYNDGSTKNVTGSSTWTSSAPSAAKVNSTGLVTALTATSNTVTITATNTTKSGSVSNTATVTTGQAALTVTSSLGTSISLAQYPTGTTDDFTAISGSTDVTSSTTFTTSNSAIISISGSQGTIGSTQGTVTITGTYLGSVGTVQITVGP